MSQIQSGCEALADTFQCECGYNGPVSNFCPHCGKPYSVPATSAVHSAVPETC